MEKIITYINNMFSACPHTEEAAQLKMQCIDTLIEKYQALIAEGKNEHEAFGIVITGFGDIEEIKKTLSHEDYQPHSEDTEKTVSDQSSMSASTLITVYREIQQQIKRHTRYELIYTGIGIAAFVFFNFIDILLRFFHYTHTSVDLSDVGACMFCICIVFAAAHFIVYTVRILQVEKNIFTLTGAPPNSTITISTDTVIKDSKLLKKKLQGTIFFVTAGVCTLLLIINASFTILAFLASVGCILYILTSIWLK